MSSCFTRVRLRTFTLFGFLLCCALPATAQTIALSLDSCKQLAASHNRRMAMEEAAIEKAEQDFRTARTNYLPKVSALASYMHIGDEVSLLSDAQKQSLGTLGTQLTSSFSSQVANLIAAHPELAGLAGGLQAAAGNLANTGNALGSGIANALRTDTRNVTAAAILLTQPLFTGGKIRAWERITDEARRVAHERQRLTRQQVWLEVEQAYWQVVSLRHKQKLALAFRDMLAHTDSDMTKMVAEGVATKSDALSVAVKLNEAEMTVTKVEDGLTLSKMLLCRLCGLPLNTDIEPSDDPEKMPVVASSDFLSRPELNQLESAWKIQKEKVKVVRSDFLPQMALMGGYAVTNPHVLNGFERQFAGTWAVGVTLKVPVWNWGEGKHKIRAARAEATMAQLKMEDAREAVELEQKQATFRVTEADRRFELAQKHMEAADENLRVAQLGHHEGVITTQNLLAAHTAWLSAHSEQIDALIDRQLSRAVLRKAKGGE